MNNAPARCEEGDLAFVRNGLDDGLLVRVDSREPDRDGWPMWWVTTMGSPLAVRKPDGSVLARTSARIADHWLIPLRMVPDAPALKRPQRARAAAKTGGRP
jgi:hypothetical protein